jgi:hypothetical protein
VSDSSASSSGPVVCPPWCNITHGPDTDSDEDDGIMHVSDAVTWDLPQRHEAKVQFDLVGYDTPGGRIPPVLEVNATEEDGTAPSFEVGTTAELDHLIGELQRTVAELRIWRAYLPNSRD